MLTVQHIKGHIVGIMFSLIPFRITSMVKVISLGYKSKMQHDHLKHEMLIAVILTDMKLSTVQSL